MKIRPGERLADFSEFVWDESYPPQPAAIIELTGINDGLLREQGRPPGEVFSELVPFLRDANLLVAHEAGFDRGMLGASLARLNLTIPPKEWLCTKRNFEWPKKYTCHRLTHLALEHFIEFRMRDMHRATADCDLLQKLVSHYDFDKALEYAREPYLIVAAKIRGPWEDGGIQNGIAKSLGFGWERLSGNRVFKKSWVRELKKSKLQSLLHEVSLSESPFEITVITEQEIK